MTIHAFLYKQHFYKQRQAEIGKKKKLKKAQKYPRSNFLKIIRCLRPRCHPKTIGDILKNVKTNKCISFYDVTINDNENETESKK